MWARNKLVNQLGLEPVSTLYEGNISLSENLQFAHFADSNPICATLCPKATCRLMGGAQYSQKKISNIWLINNWLDFAVCCHIFWACANEATTMNNNSNIWQYIRDWNSKSNILQYITIRLVPHTMSSIYLPFENHFCILIDQPETVKPLAPPNGSRVPRAWRRLREGHASTALAAARASVERPCTEHASCGMWDVLWQMKFI